MKILSIVLTAALVAAAPLADAGETLFSGERTVAQSLINKKGHVYKSKGLGVVRIGKMTSPVPRGEECQVDIASVDRLVRQKISRLSGPQRQRTVEITIMLDFVAFPAPSDADPDYKNYGCRVEGTECEFTIEVDVDEDFGND